MAHRIGFLIGALLGVLLIIATAVADGCAHRVDPVNVVAKTNPGLGEKAPGSNLTDAEARAVYFSGELAKAKAEVKAERDHAMQVWLRIISLALILLSLASFVAAYFSPVFKKTLAGGGGLFIGLLCVVRSLSTLWPYLPWIGASLLVLIPLGLWLWHKKSRLLTEAITFGNEAYGVAKEATTSSASLVIQRVADLQKTAVERQAKAGVFGILDPLAKKLRAQAKAKTNEIGTSVLRRLVPRFMAKT